LTDTTLTPEVSPPDEEAAAPGSDRDVSLEIEMSREDYQTLIDGAREAGLPPEAFLLKAIAEGAFIARNRRKGNRILVQTRTGLRELVD